MQPKLNIIVNFVAGKGKPKRALEKVKRILKENGREFSVFISEKAGQTIEIAKELSKSPCDILCLGGDGTLSEIINGIENFENVRLGIVPCGTGNDFAATLGISEKDVNAAMQVFLKNDARYVDFMQLGNCRSINVCGMGIDVDVIINYNKKKIRNKMSYMTALLKSIVFLKWKKFNLKIDGKDIGKRSVMLVTVANGKRLAGGIIISPHSEVDDGLLNVTIVNKLPKYKLLQPLLALKKGTILNFDFVESYSCKRVEMETEDMRMMNIDGELYSNENFACEVISNKLMFFRP